MQIATRCATVPDGYLCALFYFPFGVQNECKIRNHYLVVVVAVVVVVMAATADLSIYPRSVPGSLPAVNETQLDHVRIFWGLFAAGDADTSSPLLSSRTHLHSIGWTYRGFRKAERAWLIFFSFFFLPMSKTVNVNRGYQTMSHFIELLSWKVKMYLILSLLYFAWIWLDVRLYWGWFLWSVSLQKLRWDCFFAKICLKYLIWSISLPRRSAQLGLPTFSWLLCILMGLGTKFPIFPVFYWSVLQVLVVCFFYGFSLGVAGFYWPFGVRPGSIRPSSPAV